METCCWRVAAVADWMRSNRLQLDASKTDVLWCASARRQSQLPSDPLAVGSDLVSLVRCVHDLGIFIDADLTMHTQVSQTCSKCFAAHQRSIRRSVSNDVMQSLIVALVFSRLDYGCATLAGLPKQHMDRLQSVQNAAAWLIFKVCRQDHIQPLLCRSHWLQVPERISFRLAVLVLAYRCLHGSAPGYLASDLQCVLHLNARRRLRSSTTSALVAPRTVRSTIGDRTFPATAVSVWNSLPSQPGHCRCCKFSAADWKPNFLAGLTDMTKNVSLHSLLLHDFNV